jgi:hypothetical protein
MNIDKILRSEENPLVSVVRLKEPQRIQRAMAFVYKKLSRRVKVIVTCRHNFIAYPFEDFEFLLGGDRNPLNIVSPPFYHENEAHDIVFLVAHDSSKYKTFDFNLNPRNVRPANNQILYNSKCDFEPNFPNFPFYVMEQKTFEVEMDYAVKLYNVQGISVQRTNKAMKAELTKDGSVIYHSHGMRSVVGCSGSPIFDKDFNLYGMNVRGKDGEDVLIYVPVSDLNKMYQKIESEIMKYGI